MIILWYKNLDKDYDITFIILRLRGMNDYVDTCKSLYYESPQDTR